MKEDVLRMKERGEVNVVGRTSKGNRKGIVLKSISGSFATSTNWKYYESTEYSICT